LKNAEALELLVDQSPEVLEKLVQYGDEGADLIARYKDDMVEFLARTPDEAGDLALRATKAYGAAEQLAEVGLHSDEAAGLIDTILDASVHGSGDRVVIGRFFAPGQGRSYVQEALEDGGIYFNTPPGIYADALGGNRAIMEEINREFLRGQLQSRIGRIELTGESIGEVLSARPDSFTALELRLLGQEASNYGYELQGDVWKLVGR
jgi:hypothetical protein